MEGLWCCSFNPQCLTWPTQQQLSTALSSLVAHEQQPTERVSHYLWVSLKVLACGLGKTCCMVNNMPPLKEKKAPPCGSVYYCSSNTPVLHNMQMIQQVHVITSSCFRPGRAATGFLLCCQQQLSSLSRQDNEINDVTNGRKWTLVTTHQLTHC